VMMTASGGSAGCMTRPRRCHSARIGNGDQHHGHVVALDHRRPGQPVIEPLAGGGCRRI
jgi:hypothetical protein